MTLQPSHFLSDSQTSSSFLNERSLSSSLSAKSATHLLNSSAPFSSPRSSSPSDSPLQLLSQPLPTSSLPTSSFQSNPNHTLKASIIPSNNSIIHSHRTVPPRRSAASLRSIPERRSREVDQPPLPVPATPWVEPATPAFFSNHNNYSRPSSSISNDYSDLSNYGMHTSSYIDSTVSHLHPGLANSLQPHSDSHQSYGPHAVPGPRDQRSLSRYRLGPQPLSLRHSEGSQYASSSNWTPCSTTGSRMGFDNFIGGMRSSIASRDSHFTAETDYDDYCYPKNTNAQQILPNFSSPPSHSHNLSVSSSWHSGDHHPRGSPSSRTTVLTPQSQADLEDLHPTLASLIKFDQQTSAPDMVGLGITSDQTVTIARGSRAPSLNGVYSQSSRIISRPSRSASSSTPNEKYSRSIKGSTLSMRSQRGSITWHGRAPTPLQESTIHSKDLNAPSDVSPGDPPENFSTQPLSNDLSLSECLPTTSHTASDLVADPIDHMISYQGLPYDTAISPSSNTARSISSQVSSLDIQSRTLDSKEFVGKTNSSVSQSFLESSIKSKPRFYQNQSTWDDLDDHSPLLNDSTQPPGQALVLVAEGRGCIVDISNSQSTLEKLQVPQATTHLLLARTFSPYLISPLLSSRLPVIGLNLVVLDISDAGLNSLPLSITHCTALEELNISGNVMVNGELPSFLSQLEALKVLVADRCGLFQIAYSPGGMVNLRDLSVRYNHLKSLPSWLSTLQRLELLLVDGNEFEPPWQELVEPLLLSSCNSRMQRLQVSSSTYSSDRTDLSSIDLLNSPPASLKYLSQPLVNSFSEPFGAIEELGPTSQTERILQNSQIDLPTGVPTSAFNLLELNKTWSQGSGFNFNHSRTDESLSNNHLRRLHSASEMRPPINRPTSAHEQNNFSILSLIDDDLIGITQTNPVVDFRSPSSLSQIPHRPFSRNSLKNSTTTTYDQNLIHPLTSSIYSEPKKVENSDSNLIASGSVTPNSINNHRESQKKSFGFLKKMSLGKLKREPLRSRAASTEAFNRGPFPLSNSKTLDINPSRSLETFQTSLPQGLLPSAIQENRIIDDLGRKVIGTDWSVVTEPVKKKVDYRRSFLRFESPLCTPINGLTSRPHTSMDHMGSTDKLWSNSNRLKVNTVTLEDLRASESSTRIALRSIMMYLRDVHDLSVELGRSNGALINNGARPLLSTISRAPSTSTRTSGSTVNVSSSGTSKVTASGASTPSINGGIGSIELEGDNQDIPLPSGNGGVINGATKVIDNPRRRMNVIEEIVATEKSYIKCLKELQDIYILNAKSMVSSSIGKDKEPVVSPSERKIVFNNVEAIIGFHVDVLLPDFQAVMDHLSEKQMTIRLPLVEGISEAEARQLTLRREEVESQMINVAAEEMARVFIRHAAFLKLYSTYITQFDAALERLREWTVSGNSSGNLSVPAWTPSTSSTNSVTNSTSHNHHHMLSNGQKKRLKAYLKRCRAHSSHTQMNLESYLLMPVQRLPRYKLLLENLVSCTPDSVYASEEGRTKRSGKSEDIKLPNLIANRVVDEALNIITSVTAEMNERKRDSEGRQRLLYWQQRFGNKFKSPLVQPHRTLIKEGIMTITRTVKLAIKDTTSMHGASKIRVPVLSTDSKPVPMIVLLCTDLLVLVKDPGDNGRASSQVPASLFQALRLAQHSRPQFNLPATVFGADQTMVRFVDSRTIFYFQCDCQRSASEWTVAINQQVPLL
ncbi:hypothetical protein O181_026035 [Austropuccinia psidii MF-1]|uniref:DH domain-containing protein n=1 Tax=Austropuccinia psidii MF-1 TaxID=1389203 RepID=A0A9Q3CNM4_9BASI|nr:hypothetical protein [Austropuccinia psidii MF-1]